MVDEILTKITGVLAGWWDLIVFLACLYVFAILGKNWWLIHIRRKFIEGIKWITLEVNQNSYDKSDDESNLSCQAVEIALQDFVNVTQDGEDGDG